MSSQLFELGQTLQTSGIHAACEEDSGFANEITTAFMKYVKGDWGDTCEEDGEMNNNAIQSNDDRLVAKYITSQGDVFIITEYDRSATTVLFAHEY